jgi:acyl-CoA thioesterase
MTARGAVSAATAWLGAELVSAAGGEAVVTMPTRAEMANRREVVHGGFIAFLADSAMGSAMSSVLPDGERHYSFDLKLSFIATGRIGERLTAVARVLHSGRRTGVAECRVEGEDGRLVATATATFIVKLPSGKNE